LTRQGAGWIVTAPAAWVVLEYLRSHAGFLALPWATLAQSQHGDLALLQTAALGGEGAVSAVVVLGNVAIADGVRRRAWRPVVGAGVIVALVHAGGLLALREDSGAGRIRVAGVQPSIGVTERAEPRGRAAVMTRLEALTLAAGAARPALIAWPETSVPDLRNDPFLQDRVEALARAVGVPLIVGAAEVVKFAADGGPAPPRREAYDA